MNIGIKYDSYSDLPEEFYKTNYTYNKDYLFPKINKNGITLINKFQKINFFIGANNSGKSRFLRGIFKSEKSNIKIFKNEKPLYIVYEEILKLKRQEGNYSINSVNRYVKTGINTFIEKYQLNPKNNIVKIHNTKYDFNIISKDIEDLQNINFVFSKSALNIQAKQLLKVVDSFLEKIKILFIEINYYQKNKINNRKYIPILRYANANNFLKKEVYLETIKENYSISENTFVGLDFYDEIAKLNGESASIRRRKKDFERFISKNFFNNQTVEITASNEGKKIRFLIGEDDEKYLYDLGDGLGSLLILMFPIFTASKNDWIFIDEPENHLHPGFQKIFLRTILEDKIIIEKNLKLFITTHSNHFLDKSIIRDDISVFQFKKDDSKNISIKHLIKPSIETLDLLGVSNSSVLIANSSIWVEGPTDRKYLSYWLNKFSLNKNESPLIEDIDYAFFEYGGSLVSHYLFDEKFDDTNDIIREKINAFSLSNKIYLLADNDNASGSTKKGKRRKVLIELSEIKKSFKYQNTIATEIENLLPSNTILLFSKLLLKEENDFEKIKNIEIFQDDFKKVRLGDFYEKLFISNGIPKTRHRSFKAISGTLNTSYKFKLCDFLIETDIDYKSLIENNKLLENTIKDLYSFIKN